MKRLTVLKEHKQISGKSVPIYKYIYVSDADWKRAGEEAKRKLDAEIAEKSSVVVDAVVAEPSLAAIRETEPVMEHA